MKLFLIALSLCSLGFGELGTLGREQEKQVAEAAVAQMQQEAQTLVGFVTYSQKAIDAIMKSVVSSLRWKGSWKLASELETGWAQWADQLVPMARAHQTHLGIRNIGDFEPFHQWLSDAYEQIEADLGYPHCYSQRISDLKTINHGLVVVFKPCDYGYEEFYKHFATNDPKYRSLLPVVAYWGTLLGCYAGSYGTGAILVCGGAAQIAESMVNQSVAPMLAPRIYESACQQSLRAKTR